jgi:hypothetical protein
MANKKISELPLINSLSGSQVGGTVIPVVVGGTTAQISAENFSRFVNAYNAHTGSAGNTFAGPQTINSTLSVSGNTTIGGTLVVAGRLTAEEFHTEITTASVIYSSGSTKFGDTSNDTHEFTGSILIGGETLGNAGLNAFSGSFSAQLVRVQQATASLQQATSSLQAHSASVNAQLLAIQQTTQSLQVATASIQAQTASLLAFTASQDSRNFTLSQVTGSFRGEIGGLEEYSASLKAAAIISSSTQIQNYDLFALNSVLYIATGSIKGEIAGIEEYTASLKSQAIVSSSTQIQNYDVFALNSNLYIATGSIKGEVAGIEAYTASLKGQAIVSSSTQIQNYDLFALNSNLYTSTGSLIGITNGLMAFTAALDNTYATDAQLYELYQATASLNTTTGSIKGEIAGIESYTASLKGQTIVSSSTQVQNYDLFALNSNLYTSTGSLIGITNGLMAYTASNETWKTGVRGEVNGIEAYTSSLKSALTVNSTDATILGSLTINQNLVVLGSASIQYITSSQLNIGDNIISVNTSAPSIRFGGFAVIDSGSNPQQSGSLLFDSQENQWIFVHQTAGTVTSSLLLMGPQTYNNIGGETNLTTNRLLKSVNNEHVGDTNISDDGTDVIVNSNTQITGSLAINDSATNFLIEGNGFSQTYLTSNGAIVLNPGFGGVEMVGSYRTFKATDITADGTLLVKGSTTLGDSGVDNTTISGSLLVSGSSHTIQNGYVILQQVSQSLNFVDDTAAAAGGVPLGGLYRSGNFIVIRIV